MRTTKLSVSFLAITVLGIGAAAQCEEVELAPSVSVDGGWFGFDVDTDGDRVIVGQAVNNGLGEAAYVYERSGSDWVLDARLTQPGQELDVWFGEVVAIEGDVAVVSARDDDQAGPDFGAAHVYERQGGVWMWVAKLLPTAVNPSFVDPLFAFELAVENGTIFVGSWQEQNPNTLSYTGAVYVFEKQSGQWAETQKLFGPSFFDNYGRRFAANGNRLAVGIPYTSGYDNQWQIRIYERTGPGQPYTLMDLIDGPAGIDFYFEIAVDIDGDDLVVGARDITFVSDGVVYFYRRTAGAWGLVDSFRGAEFNNGPNTALGYQGVGIEGGLAVVSDPGSFLPDGVPTGSVHVFRSENGQWIERSRVMPSDGVPGDAYARKIAFDAGRLVVGARSHTHVPGGPEDGAAYVVNVNELPTIYCTGKLNSLGCAANLDWHGVASPTNVLPFDITASSILSNKPGLFFYGTTGRANLPFLGGVLCALPPLTRTPPQVSGGNGPPDDCSGAFAIDLNARIRSGVDPDLVPGVTVTGQFWSRDPDQLDGTGVHLTEAVEATICP